MVSSSSVSMFLCMDKEEAQDLHHYDTKQKLRDVKR